MKRTSNRPDREENASPRENRRVAETREGAGTGRADGTTVDDASSRGGVRVPDGHGETPTDAPGSDVQSATRLDSTLYLLSHHRRREALWYLRSAGRPVHGDELVDYLSEVARRESPTARADVVAVDVVHTHLPRLERSSAVETEDDGERLRYVGGELVDPLLDAIGRIEGRRQCDDE